MKKIAIAAVAVFLALDASAQTAPVAPHHYYSVKRGTQYGYTDESGQVHFFGNVSHSGNIYQIVSFDNANTAMLRCQGDCSVVDIFATGGQQTFQPQRGSILWSVVHDMTSGALN